MPSCIKSEQEWWHQDNLFLRMRRVMNAVESYFDVVFIDCGSKQDNYTQRLLRESDVVY